MKHGSQLIDVLKQAIMTTGIIKEDQSDLMLVVSSIALNLIHHQIGFIDVDSQWQRGVTASANILDDLALQATSSVIAEAYKKAAGELRQAIRPTSPRMIENDPYFSKSRDDEPSFIILGRDPVGYATAITWCHLREHLIETGVLPNNEHEQQHIRKVKDLAEQIKQYQPKSYGGNPIPFDEVSLF